MKHIVLLIVLFIAMVARAQNPKKNLRWDPPVFIENKGQVVDENNKPNNAVKFLYHDGLLNLELKPTGFSYEVFRVTNNKGGYDEATGINTNDAPNRSDKPDLSVASHRVDVIFVGANRKVVPVAAYPIEGYFNFIFAPVSTNQHLGVQGFQKITYPGLYPGIDLVFYAPDEADDASSLRYEFIVHPGADLSKIKFRYEGATDFALTDAGDFMLNTSFGFIQETKPKYFVDGKQSAAEAKFLLNGNEKSFSSLDYNHDEFLIIDPNIIWGSYYGGDVGDEIAEVVVDSKDRATIDGNTLSLNHIASNGAYQSTFAGGFYDFFVGRFKSNGKLDWSTYFGGTDKEDCYGLGIDQNDHPIAVGNTKSQGLATPGAFKDAIFTDASDILIAKFQTDGSLMWSTYFGGEEPENARNCVCDSKGKIYLSGTTSSTTGIAYGNAYQPINGGTDDTWLAKFTKDGYPIWSTYYGGTGVDRSHVVNLDKKGNLFVGGTCTSLEVIASPGAFHTTYGGGEADAFLAKYDTAGNFIWGTYVGGAKEDRVRGVECDGDGNVYVGGFTLSDTGIASPGSYQPAIFPPSGGSQTEDAYLVKFNTNGVRQWGTYYGGTTDEEMWGMTSDNKVHSVYIMGSTASPTNIVNGSAMQTAKSGGEDGFLAKFRENGTVEWSTYFGGKTGDQFEDAMADTSDFLYVAGRNTSSTMPVTSGVYQSTFYGGVSDVMLYKFYIGSDCLDQYEPNESSGNAFLTKAIAVTDSTNYGFNGSIVRGTDKDWFKLKVKAPNTNIRVILQDATKNYDLKFYTKQGNLLYQSLHTDLTPDTITANNLADGTYKFEIAHSNLIFDSLGCYHIRVYQSASPFQRSSVLEEQVAPEVLVVFPNPADQAISFNITSGKDQKAGISIFDLSGREVYSNDLLLIEGVQQIKIPVLDLSSGIFQVVIMCEDHVWNGKFIKQ